MPRWKPDAGQRLVMAAFELFAEQGYDGTTVSQIATRSGLTRSTFHRHFSDKREVLVAGQETLSELFRAGIADAPDDATPLAFWVALAPDQYLQLDDVVLCERAVPGRDEPVRLSGVVTQVRARHEGAHFDSGWK